MSMRVQRRTILAMLGDVGFPEYDGAVVYRQVGRVYMSYLDHFDDGSNKVADGTVDVPDAKSWRSEWWARDLSAIARSVGSSVREIEEQLDSRDPVARASALYYDVKAHSGLGGEEDIISEREANRRYAWTRKAKRR